MLESFLSKQKIKIILSSIFLLPALLVIFAPAVYSFKWFVDYSVQVMFLFVTKNYWLGLSWGSCIVLCMFLKYTSNQAFSFESPSGGRTIKVASYNISFVEDSVINIVHSIIENDANLISIQEVTPDIDSLMTDKLKEKYAYHYSLKRADYYGMMIFSSFPITQIDTFNFGIIPNIKGNLKIENLESGFDFIVSYCPPSFSSSTYQLLKDQLKAIALKATESKGAVITMGTYNTVPWAPEVQDFKKIGRLIDSRLGLAPTASSSSNPLFQIPIDHIFHSEKLKCINFQVLSYNQHPHLGIEGTYEIIP
jgi:endonuclease/exonuclease/phosphatase (EEP) superfamily protein YafD